MAKKVRSDIISPPRTDAETGSVAERRVLKLLESGAAYRIRDLATQLHLSPSHLQRLFKNETGLRMGEWLTAFRLQKAAYLLANSYLSVKEIARSVGYEHLSSFIRAFERKYVLTPTRFRERERKRKREHDNTGADRGGD
jgi:two-component system response regulator YesN